MASTGNKGPGAAAEDTTSATEPELNQASTSTKSHHEQVIQNLISEFADGRIVTEQDTSMKGVIRLQGVHSSTLRRTTRDFGVTI